MKRFTLIALCITLIVSALAFAERTPVLRWEAIYDDPIMWDDYAKDLAVDASGNVYITGDGGGNFTTIKYDPNGNPLWLATYYRNQNNRGAIALKVDGFGYVYVAGTTWDPETNFDYSTIKYDPNGNELWVAHYNGEANLDDCATALAIDNYGNVLVTGYSDGNETYWDYATVKYDPNGNQMWVRCYHNPQEGYGIEQATDIAVDHSGNVYVTGFTDDWWEWDENSVTIKYDPDGKQLWMSYWRGYPIAMALDDSSNVYVTGGDNLSGYYSECVTVKYDTDGHLLWADSYEDPNHSRSSGPTALALDNFANVYITGSRDHNDWYDNDYLTIKYDTNGNLQWTALYDGDVGACEVANGIAIDNSGNVYVTGIVPYGDYLTIKYSPNGDTLWMACYDYPPKVWDNPVAIAVDDSGNVYITGNIGVPSYGYSDYATIKYTQHDYCVKAIDGDLNGDCKVEFTDFALLAQAWLSDYDWLDLDVLADDWLTCNFALEEDCW